MLLLNQLKIKNLELKTILILAVTKMERFNFQKLTLIIHFSIIAHSFEVILKIRPQMNVLYCQI
jgi:hypothetical protein